MIESWTDHARRRVVVALLGDVSGPDYVAWLMDRLTTRPELSGYDFIYDMQAYQGRISHDDIAEMAPRYAALVGDRDRGATTILVTTDEGFRFWAELLAVQFPNRRWRVVPGMAEAEAVLAEQEAARGHDLVDC
jgi:hypothetical protein